jgi:outer membrane protein OmpA-like peptidoglycan-associated protein
LAVAIALLALLGWWGWRWAWNQHKWTQYVSRLRSQPGILVTDIGKEGGQWQINGLRDPIAADPRRLLREAAIDPSKVVEHWQSFESLEPALVLQRMAKAVKPPTGITLSVVDDHIVARGSASSGWLQRAQGYVRTLPDGAPLIDLSQIKDVSSGTLGELRAAIQSKEIRFGYNESLPAPSEDTLLDELADELRQLETMAAARHVSVRVTVTGHSDSTGKGTFNLSLSLARAEGVRALLKKRNVDPDLLAIRGAGPLEPLQAEATDADRSVNRRVSLTVAFDE